MRRQIVGLFLAIMLMTPTVYSTPLGIMVPAYFNPSAHAAYWNELDFGASRVPLIAIMNNGSPGGPGTSLDTNYVNAITKMHQAGGAVIGYVYTSEGARALSDVEADIDAYLSWYDVDGFFLDEMAHDANATNYAYYQSIFQYIKSKGAKYSVTGNSGVNTQESYISIPTVDMVMDFEGYGTNYQNWSPSSWAYEYPAGRFVNLPHYVTDATLMTNYVNLAVNRNAGWVYVGDNSYSDLPAYWTNEVELVQSLNVASLLPAITDSALPADQTTQIGSSITFQVAASGQTPLLYQWFFNTNAIRDATNVFYTVPSVQFTNVGSYYVQVSNSISSTNSRAALLTAVSTNASAYAKIVIDGSFDDWVTVPLAYTQAQLAGATIQFQNLYVANDDSYLYIKFSLYTNGNPFISSQNIFVDADANYNTGNHENGIGSDLLIQAGKPYQENSGIFNAGMDSNLNWLSAPAAPTNQFEVRISRNTLGTNGLPVLASNTIALFLESSEGGSIGNEWFPNIAGGLIYTFATQSTQPVPLSINYATGNIIISWVGSGILQSCNSLTNGGAWTNVPDASSPYTMTPSNSQEFFRLMQ